MLNRLKSLHAEILGLLDELEQVARSPLPEIGLLSGVRHKLTRASRSRTMLLETAYPRLCAGATAVEKALIDRLRREGKDQLISSAEHIGTWSVRQITAQWSGYCAASRRMRVAMRVRIEDEKKIYPLLDHLQLTIAA